MTPPNSFTFESYSYDHISRTASFVYALDTGLTFTETLILPADTPDLANNLVVDQLLFALHLALGMSYWKAYCPKTMTVNSGTLSASQADFWNTLYTKGLGEFFYTNNIDFRNLVRFPFENNAIVGNADLRSLRCDAHTTPLVPLGGGKDSLTTVALLQRADISFDTFSLNHYPIIDVQVESLHATTLHNAHRVIERRIDPQLLTLNTVGAYNGHVPISSIYALTSVLLAEVYGYSHVILSNERSANVGNVQYLGEEINHQWSKSLEFEKLFQQYLTQDVGAAVTYFSLLRPLSELHVTKLFSAYGSQWLDQFTSCNRNFAIQKTTTQRWCGHCPKCVFVFLCLAPFVPKEKLMIMFKKNILADESLWPLCEELLGIARTKPFDCVGTPDEVLVACDLIRERGEYNDDILMKKIVGEVLPTIPNLNELRAQVLTPSTEHVIPQQFQQIILTILK